MQRQNPSIEHSSAIPVTPARLMAPHEVSVSLVDRARDAKCVSGRWFLCGDVTGHFLQPAKALDEQVPMRLSAFHSPDRLPYGVITHQVEAMQHRFLLPLYEERVALCLRRSAEEPLAFSLGDNESDRALIQMPSVPSSVWRRLLALHVPLTHASARQAVEEFPQAVAEACEFDLVASLLYGYQVQEVSVSALLPVQAVAMLANRRSSRPH